MKKIQVKVTGVEHAFPLCDFVNGQGNLKILSKDNYKKLRMSLIDHGIISPIHVWRPPQGPFVMLDGHQRHRALTELERGGFEIPEVPTVFVEADSLHEAKKKLLALASQYGTFDDQGLYEYMSENQIMFDDVEKYLSAEKINEEKFYKEHFDNAVEEPKEKKKKTCPKCGAEF